MVIKSDMTTMPAVSVTVVRVLRELAAETPVSVRVSGEWMVPLLANEAILSRILG